MYTFLVKSAPASSPISGTDGKKREKDRERDENVEMQHWNLSGSADIIKRVNKFIWCINCACKKNEIQRKTGNKNEKI